MDRIEQLKRVEADALTRRLTHPVSGSSPLISSRVAGVREVVPGARVRHACRGACDHARVKTVEKVRAVALFFHRLFVRWGDEALTMAERGRGFTTVPLRELTVKKERDMTKLFMPMLGLLLACSICALAMEAPPGAGLSAQAATAGQEEKDENFLDLTKYKPVESRPDAVTAATGTRVQDTRFNPSPNGRHEPARTAPLKVTLLSLDADSYQLGANVIYEVMLENVSRELQVIPWSPDENKIKPQGQAEPPGYLDAFLSLVVRDKDLGEQLIAVRGLYGSEMAQASLKRLLPGEKVRIRAQGRMFFAVADASEKASKKLVKSALKLKVQARYSLHEGTSAPMVSTNNQLINLLPKP